jgi:hypothetical protein
MAEVAGRIVRSEDQIWFVPEEIVEQLAPRAVVSPIPGSRLLMALVDGAVLPVLPMGRADHPLLVCLKAGERVALCGLHVAAAGSFERLDDGAHVRFEDRSVPYLDLSNPLDLLPSGARGSPFSGEEAE